MPGQIKIDDGAGNYTVLTNGGSLGSDKTITIPNTTGTMALTSDITSGLSSAQQFRLTANITTTGLTDITSNIAVPNGTLQTNKGSLVSESSGIFSFSETGYYLIILAVTSNFNADNAYAPVQIRTTNDNFSSEDMIGIVYARSKQAVEVTGSTSVIVKITSTTNDKIKFATDITTNGIVSGATGQNQTSFTFLKVGEL